LDASAGGEDFGTAAQKRKNFLQTDRKYFCFNRKYFCFFQALSGSGAIEAAPFARANKRLLTYKKGG
jgi:hypothetical protein